MFYGNVFRQTPVALLALVILLIFATQVSSLLTGNPFTFSDFAFYIVMFSLLGAAAFSHSLRFLPDGKIQSSLLFVWNKKTNPSEGLLAEIKPAFWSNRSRTLIISQKDKKLYSVNIYDLGLRPNQNARDLLLRLRDVTGDKLELDNDLKRFLENKENIYGELIDCA